MFFRYVMVTSFLRLRRDETGAALVEYALLLTFVVLAAIAAMVFLGNSAPVPINNVAGYVNSAS